MPDIITSTDRSYDKEKKRLELALESKKNSLDKELALAKEEAKKDYEARIEALDKNYKDKLQEEIYDLEAEFRLKNLQQKQDLIQKIVEEAKDKLQNIDEAEVSNMLKGAFSLVPDKPTKLYVGEATNISRDKLEEVIKDYQGVELVEEKVQAKTGFLLEQDKISYNFYIEDLLEKVREKALRTQSKLLFED